MRLNILTSKDTTIRPNCGIYVLEELARKKGLRSFLLDVFPRRSPQACYSDADLVLSLTYGILCGAEYLEDLNEVKRQLDADYLTIPSSDTIEYRLNQLSVPDEQITNETTGVVHYFNCNDRLNTILVNLGAWLNPNWKRSPVTLDYDNTIITTGRDSEMTYKKAKGYQPGVGIIDNQPIYIEGRNGNSNSPYRMGDTLERMVSQLEAAGIKVGALRIDAAAFSQHVFKWLQQRPDIKYYIGSRAQSVEILKDAKWEAFDWADVRTEVTSIEYNGPGMREEPDHRCRLVVYRQKRTGQQDLFYGDYQYRFILTNDWEMTGEQVVRHYSNRGGAERTFEYMKYDFNWRHMPFGEMRINTSYLLITSMCHLIYRWILKKLECFKRVVPSIRPKKFYLFFVNVIGKWVQSGRTKYLKLYSTRPYEAFLNSA